MGSYQESVLIVEDDTQISAYMRFALEGEGFTCVCTDTGQDALKKLVYEPVDILLLDLGLPDYDGIDIIKKVREWSEIPIIVVSARDQDKEKVNALDSGADDYLIKPFSAPELMARVRVAVRHLHKQKGSARQSSVSVGELRMDYEKRLVHLEGKEIHLTPMEYSLLSLFFKNVGKVLTSDYIIKEVWGSGYGTEPNALRTLMAGLRRKIEKVPATPRYIITEIGVGYRLVDE